MFLQAFLPNSSPRLIQQLTTDYSLSPHVWNEIVDKMNKMAKENRLIKQAVLGTYEKMKGKYPISRNRNQNNPKDDSGKQISQRGKKCVQFKSNTSTITGHSPAVTLSGNVIGSILKSSSSLTTSTNLVSTIAEETESQLDAEAEGQAHNLFSDCEVIMIILHPDIDYSSDSDSDKLNYTDERLKNLYVTKHIVSIIQPTPGRLATFNVKLFNTESVTVLFDTEATCSCISFPLYNQIADKSQMVEMQLWVGQVHSTSLCPKGIVKVT